jgi:hypothetical protein
LAGLSLNKLIWFLMSCVVAYLIILLVHGSSEGAGLKLQATWLSGPDNTPGPELVNELFAEQSLFLLTFLIRCKILYGQGFISKEVVRLML